MTRVSTGAEQIAASQMVSARHKTVLKKLSSALLATIVFIIGSVVIAGSSNQALAAQMKPVEANGRISFYASTSSVTRLAIKDGRVRRIINDSTKFEMTNDETTGDVFLRFAGDTAEKETGFIVTENGETISYTLIPTSKAVEPIIINLIGKEAPLSTSADGSDFSGGFSDDIAATLAEVVRKVAVAHVFGQSAKGKVNRIRKTLTDGPFKVHLLVVEGGENGRLLSESEFAKPGSRVRAVWFQQSALGANERSFVIVVEDK